MSFYTVRIQGKNTLKDKMWRTKTFLFYSTREKIVSRKEEFINPREHMVINICLRSVIGRNILTNIHKRKCQINNTCAVMFVLTFSFHHLGVIFTGITKSCDHPRSVIILPSPLTITHDHPRPGKSSMPPPTTSHNVTATTHDQP